MFDRKAYKQIAKKQLQGRYATPILIMLFTTAVILVINIPTFIQQARMYEAGGEYYTMMEGLGSLMGVSVILMIFIVKMGSLLMKEVH